MATVTSPILRRMFGHPQGPLGRLGGIIMARTNRRCAAWVIELLDVRSTDKVLEVGFGPGVAIQMLIQRASAGRVVGVDASPVMIEQAIVRNRQAIGDARLQLHHGFAHSLPFADASFDKALCINSMQIWPDVSAGLRQLCRVLKVGGRIAVAFTPYSGQARSGVRETLIAAGFASPELVEKDRNFCLLATKP